MAAGRPVAGPGSEGGSMAADVYHNFAQLSAAFREDADYRVEHGPAPLTGARAGAARRRHRARHL